MVIALALPLLALVAGLFVYQASTTARRSANALGGFLLLVVRGIPLIGPTTAELFVKLARWIAHEFGQAFIIIEHRIVKFIVAKWHSDVHSDSVSLTGPEEQFKEGWNIRYHFVPGYVKTATTPIRQQAVRAETDAKEAMGIARSHGKAIGKTAPARTAVKVEKVAMPHALEWDWIHHHFKALQSVVAGAGAIAIPGTVPLPFGRTVKNIRRRLRKLERLAYPLAIAAALASVMRLGSVRCLTSGAVGKIARRLCGLGRLALDDFLAVLVDLYILENICTVITLLEDGLRLIDGPLNDLIATSGKMFVHCKYNLPPKQPIKLPYLPPAGGIVLSLPA